MSEELSIIERFREQHHAVAKMFASGMTPWMIRQRTGISMRRLTLLWNDPSFQELVKVYGKRVEEKWNANLDTYLDLGMSNMILAESQIAERLDDSMNAGAEPIPLAMLDKISQGRADRFGYSKHSVMEHKHDFASLLDGAIARSGKAKEVKLIEGQANQGAPRELTASPSEGESKSEPLSRPAARPRSFAQVLNPIKKRKVA